jgi:hypothetical protein
MDTGTLTNTAAITITSSAASGATATHVAVFDSLTGGNMLMSGALSSSKTIATGDEIRFNATSLTLTVS